MTNEIKKTCALDIQTWDAFICTVVLTFLIMKSFPCKAVVLYNFRKWLVITVLLFARTLNSQFVFIDMFWMFVKLVAALAYLNWILDGACQWYDKFKQCYTNFGDKVFIEELELCLCAFVYHEVHFTWDNKTYEIYFCSTPLLLICGA